MQIETFEIARRFCGPPRSANGGYTCGRIAKHLRGSIAVRLNMPPPLEVQLRLESSEHSARLFHGEAVIGEAKAAPLDLHLPVPPSFAQAKAASPSYLGFRTHTFPGCFVCGPQRERGDGLRIYPGPLEGSSMLAAPWTPDDSLADEAGYVHSEYLWSALDCPGAFCILPLPEGVAIVLGALCASIVGIARAGEHCVVTAWPLDAQGRKHFAGTAIFGDAGQPIAFAKATWIEVSSDSWA
jgi:hypothetical protein